MYQTETYNDPSIMPSSARPFWDFFETNSACAMIKATCPSEWNDIIDVLSKFRLDTNSWLKPGGSRGEVATLIDKMFSDRGWSETRLDLETKGILSDRAGRKKGELKPIRQEGYLVDNFKNRIVLDVEWNAKDGNIDRDLASYRSWFEAGVVSAGVIITKDRHKLKALAKKIWDEHSKSLLESERKKLPIDLSTSTVTAFDKAILRVKRGVMGSCPVLIIAANDKTWNGEPYITR